MKIKKGDIRRGMERENRKKDQNADLRSQLVEVVILTSAFKEFVVDA